MSKLTDIKYKIDQLDGGAFQNLCDAYLACRGYGAGYSLGMNTGTNKTAKGNPDTYFLTADGKYIFAMYSTQKTNFFQKTQEDIQKCFDKGKTGLSPKDVAEIVYCYTYGRLSAGENQSLIAYCKARNATLTLIGIDEIGNDLFFKYPRLAKDHLGISVDTGQIMSIEDFVQTHDANRMAAPLDTAFLCREEELKTATEKIEESNVLVIAGPAGTGKTRLALKLCEDYAKEKGLDVLCIKSNGLELYEDLTAMLEPGIPHLVFVDDANELSGLHFVLTCLGEATPEKRCIRKIVITVRDYARQQVVRQVLAVEKPQILKISHFKDDEIRKLMESAYGITNPLFLERIVAIAEGNARLAMLAGKLAAESETLKSIRDASELYETYYSKQIDALTGSETGIRSAGIIAFFQALHLGHLEHLMPIFAAAKITEDQFVADVKQLHGMELVDLCQDTAARISDQSFSNYLIKYVLIDKKLIPLNQMIESGFSVNQARTISACNILLYVFVDRNIQEYMEQQIGLVWDRLAGDSERFPAFFKAFHMIRPTETLVLLNEQIAREPARSFDVHEIEFKKSEGEKTISDDVIDALCGFRLHEQLPEAVALLLRYYQKRPDLFEQVYSVLAAEFGVKKDSQRYSYYTQKVVVEQLCALIGDNPTENNALLFVRVAEQFLRLIVSRADGGHKNTITFYTMPLSAEEAVFEYRGKLIIQLYEMYQKGYCRNEIESLLMDYGERGESIEYEIVRKEINAILAFFPLFSTNSLYHCVIAAHIQDVALCAEYDCGDALIPFLKARKYKIYSALKSRQEDRGDYDYRAKEERHRERVQELIQDYNLDDFRYMFDVCIECQHSVDREAYQLSLGLEYAFDSIFENKELFVEVVKAYMAANTPYDLRGDTVLHNLFKIKTPSEVKSLITSCDYSQQNTWLWYFYSEMPEDQISEEWAVDLLHYFQNPSKSVRSSPYRPLDCIKKYERVDRNIVLKASRIISDQYELSPFIFSLYFFFAVCPQRGESEKILHQYASDISLLEDIYLKYLNYSASEDYDGELLEQIINVDPAFLDRYVEYGLEKEPRYFGENGDWGRRLAFIWKSEQYLSYMSRVSDYIMERSAKKPRAYSSLIGQLLICEKERYSVRQDEWIKHTIEQHYRDKQWMYELFSSMSEHGPDRRKNALKEFLKLNDDYDAFEKLPLESSYCGGWGSMIPYIQQRIDYLSSLLPLLTGLGFLRHKRKVENDIEGWKNWIKNEEIEELLAF